MDVMVSVKSVGTDIYSIGVVAFELDGTVQEPHELLQYNQRCYHWRVAASPAHEGAFGSQRALDDWAQAQKVDITTALRALDVVLNTPRRGLLLKRGRIWASPKGVGLEPLRRAYRVLGIPQPWEERQELDYRTLFWAGNKVPDSYVRAPDLSEADLIEGHALHDAACQVVVLQAAYRALMLHRAAKTRRRPK